MNPDPTDPLDRISRRIQALRSRLGETSDSPPISTLREIGHELVSLAGELTTLGVDLAIRERADHGESQATAPQVTNEGWRNTEMQGTLVVNSWVGIHEGCDINFRVNSTDDVYVTVTGDADPFELFFQANTLRQFIELGGEALAEMTALAERHGQ